MQVAKNIPLHRKTREPDVKGVRVPDLDKYCPSCEARFLGENKTFAYQMNVGGRSFVSHWCSRESREVE